MTSPHNNNPFMLTPEASQVLFSFRLECNKSRRKRLDGLSKGGLPASHIMVTVSLKVKVLTV